MASDIGLLEPGLFRYHGDAIEAKIALGRLDEAEALLETARATADTLHRPWLDLVVGRGTACAARRLGAISTGRPRCCRRCSTATALASHSNGRAPSSCWAPCTAAIDRRKLRGPRSDGRGGRVLPARSAGSGSTAPRSELSRVGGRAPSDDLTPTERQVAELIAAGRTYREAAAELFISPKTVQWNLSKVYSKLGIRSRAELPGRLKED